MDRCQLVRERVSELLANANIKCEREGAAIVASLVDGRCEIEVTELNYQATDGARIVGVASLYNHCTDPSPGVSSLPAMGRWNAFTSMLSTVQDSRGMGLAARVLLYDDPPEVIERAYAPLLYCAAWLSFGLSQFLADGYPNAADFLSHGATGDMPPSMFGILGDAPNKGANVSFEDLQAIEAFATSRKMLSFSDANGVSVEFPWDKGALGAAMDVAIGAEPKRTSLFMIEVDAKHPLFGRGVLVRLQLPIDIEPARLPTLVNKLNLWELQGRDTPPFFGSWCIDPKFPSPAFNVFIPAMFSGAVNVQNLFTWTFLRHRAVMNYLKQLGAEAVSALGDLD